MRIMKAAFAVAAAVLSAGCSFAAADAPVKCSAPVAPATAAQVVTAENNLGFALLRAKQNVVISPFSIAQALGVIYLGARGETAKAFVKSSVVPPVDPASFACAAQNLRAALPQTDADVTLDFANALWVAQGLPLENAFVEQARAAFGADATTLDFGSPDAVRTINDWVSQRTKGHIPSILDNTANAEAVVTNAVYFKGLWDQPFAPAQTRNDQFFGAAGPTRLPFMNQTANFGYHAGAGYQVVRLGYRGERFAMYVVLPKKGTGLNMQGTLSGSFASALAHVSYRRIDLLLPKLHIEYATGLIGPLTDLGLGVAFTDRADFAGISAKPLKISSVIHKTTLDVDEKGTTAAAATAIVMEATGRYEPIAPPIVVKVDHPFFCIIRDDRSGAVLFLGAIATI